LYIVVHHYLTNIYDRRQILAADGLESEPDQSASMPLRDENSGSVVDGTYKGDEEEAEMLFVSQ
jgi:hypothetical protein